ncbi:hypothetical protein AB0G81_06865 [Streptomyces asoensis]|uniref:hypothetical protein n=1 Tax=Streptomyces asoensis TaxID=249586 RepID=UPI0033E16BF9
MHNRTVAAGLLSVLLLTGCTTNSGDTADKPGPSASGVRLSAGWGPKLITLTDTKRALCNQAGDHGCADHVAAIAIEANALQDVIEKTGGSYPRTKIKIMEIVNGATSYTVHECGGDTNASIAGSPCPDDVFQVRGGAETLPFTLEADEAGR